MRNESEHGKQWYQEHKEQKKAYAKVYLKLHKARKSLTDSLFYRRLKIEVLSHYSPEKLKCSRCDEDRLRYLNLDHINEEGREHRITNHMSAGTQTWLWAKKNRFPPIFQVLCYRCNTKKSRSYKEKRTM